VPSSGPARFGAAIVALCSLVLAVQALGAGLPILAGGREATVDYGSLVVAGRLAGTDPAALYDPAAQRLVQQQLDPGGRARPFTNPPPVATAARLLGATGIRGGFVVVQLAGGAAVLLLAGLVWRLSRRQALSIRLAMTIGTSASASVATAMAEGAISGVSGAGLALVAVGDARRRDGLVVAGLLLAATKPHLAVVAALLVAARRRGSGAHADRAAWTRGLVAAAVVVAISLVTPGPVAWLHYPAALVHAGGPDAAALGSAEHWWTVGSVLQQLAGPAMRPAAVAGTWIVWAAGLVVLTRLARRRVRPVPLGPLLVAGLVLAPHANPHDALWVPVVFALVRADAGWDRRRRGERLALSALAVAWPPLSLVATAFADGGGSVLAVAALGTFAVLAVLGARPATIGTTPRDRTDHAGHADHHDAGAFGHPPAAVTG